MVKSIGNLTNANAFRIEHNLLILTYINEYILENWILLDNTIYVIAVSYIKLLFSTEHEYMAEWTIYSKQSCKR